MVLRQHASSGGGQVEKTLPLPAESVAAPPPAPVAWVIAPASSLAARPQMPAHGGSMRCTLPLPIGLPLQSPPATLVSVETPASSPATSPPVPAHGGERSGLTVPTREKNGRGLYCSCSAYGAPTPGASDTGSSAGALTGATTSDTGAWGLHGENSAATGRPTATITPSDGGMGKDASVLTGGIATGTGARGGSGGGLAWPSTPARQACDIGGGGG